MPPEILVPLDYSDTSLNALQFAASLAEKLGGALTLLHFWEAPPVARHGMVAAGSSEATRGLAELVIEQAENELTSFIQRAQLPPSLPVRRELREGNALKETLAASETGQYSLIVMGTHGHTGLGHLMLGSVAERVVRLSPIPVISVPQCKSS